MAQLINKYATRIFSQFLDLEMKFQPWRDLILIRIL